MGETEVRREWVPQGAVVITQKADGSVAVINSGEPLPSADSTVQTRLLAMLGGESRYAGYRGAVATTYSSTTNKIEFSTEVHHLYFVVRGSAPVRVVYNATSDSQADTWLSAAGSATASSTFWMEMVASTAGTRTFDYVAAGVTRLDFLYEAASGTAQVAVVGVPNS